MVESDLEANYRRLKAERGLTWEQLADQTVGPQNRSLAAWMRSQAADEAAADRSEPPRQRTRTRHETA